MLESIPPDVRAHSHVFAEGEEWLVGAPLTPNAMYWWGAFTEWCTAYDTGLFYEYALKGTLVVFRSRTTSFRWLLHPVTGEFRDYRNKVASWRGFLMRYPTAANDLLGGLAQTVGELPRPDFMQTSSLNTTHP